MALASKQQSPRKPARWRRRGRPTLVPSSLRVRPQVESLEDRNLLSNSIPLNAFTWSALGPAPITNGQTPGSQPVSGRVTGIAADPTNANIIYVATAGGGVWKTINGGTNWAPLTDEQPSVPLPRRTEFMGAIAVAPSNSSTIYAGTGEANNSYDSYYGRGVLKSTNGGATWTLLTNNNQFDRRTISKIVVDPSNANIVYVAIGGMGTNGLAGNTGIYKSTNGGTTWNLMVNGIFSFTGQEAISDLVMNPSNHMMLYAAVGSAGGSVANGVYETLDGGASWTFSGNFPHSGVTEGRIALAIAPSAPGTLYASIADTRNGNLLSMLKTTNGGATWAPVTGTPPNYLNGQGWYDTTLAVDPTNANTVYAGGGGSTDANHTGSQLIRSFDGGATWTDISGVPANQFGPHADHHSIGFDAFGRVLVGTDGGIWRINDIISATWTDLNSNLNTIQFTGVALDPTDPNWAYGGSQDNGTARFNDNIQWKLIDKGDGPAPAPCVPSTCVPDQPADGGFIRVPDKTNPSRAYHTLARDAGDPTNFFWRTDTARTVTSGGWVNKSPNTTGDNSRFYPPVIADPARPQRLLLGTDKVYETTNGGDTWTPRVGTGWPGAVVDALAVNGNTIYATVGGGRLFVSTDDGTTWTERDPIPPNASVRFTGIVVDPRNAKTAYVVAANFGDVTGGGHVWRTRNGGATWKDITANLPNLPTWSVALDPDPVLYVGTDDGVYVCNDPTLPVSQIVWYRLGRNMPRVQVTDLEVNTDLHIIGAGTHGRGLWEIQSWKYINPEVDSFSTSLAHVRVKNTDTNQTVDLTATGPTLIHVFIGPHGETPEQTILEGRDVAPTQMLRLDLTGTGFTVHLRTDRLSMGAIVDQVNNGPGILQLPPFISRPASADSYFNVFAQINVGGQTFQTRDPEHVTCVITHKPPYTGHGFGETYSILKAIRLFQNGRPSPFKIILIEHTPDPVTYVLQPPSRATIGVPFLIPIIVRTPTGGPGTDYHGIVHFTSTDGQATLPPDYPFTAADRGVHTFMVTLFTAGPQTITITDTSNSAETSTSQSILVVESSGSCNGPPSNAVKLGGSGGAPPPGGLVYDNSKSTNVYYPPPSQACPVNLGMAALYSGGETGSIHVSNLTFAYATTIPDNGQGPIEVIVTFYGGLNGDDSPDTTNVVAQLDIPGLPGSLDGNPTGYIVGPIDLAGLGFDFNWPASTFNDGVTRGNWVAFQYRDTNTGPILASGAPLLNNFWSDVDLNPPYEPGSFFWNFGGQYPPAFYLQLGGFADAPSGGHRHAAATSLRDEPMSGRELSPASGIGSSILASTPLSVRGIAASVPGVGDAALAAVPFTSPYRLSIRDSIAPPLQETTASLDDARRDKFFAIITKESQGTTGTVGGGRHRSAWAESWTDSIGFEPKDWLDLPDPLTAW